MQLLDPFDCVYVQRVELNCLFAEGVRENKAPFVYSHRAIARDMIGNRMEPQTRLHFGTINFPQIMSFLVLGGTREDNRTSTKSCVAKSGETRPMSKTDDHVDPGSSSTLAMQWVSHRDRLVRLVAVRLDPRVRGRIDPSDVIQETYLEAAQRSEEFFRDPDVSCFVWLRYLALQRVAILPAFHQAWNTLWMAQYRAGNWDTKTKRADNIASPWLRSKIVRTPSGS